MNPVLINCRNLPCPQPVMKLHALFKTTRPAALEIVVDNEPALENVSRFLRNSSYTVRHVHENGLWRINAQTDQASAPESSEQAPAGENREPEDGTGDPCYPGAEHMGTLVLIISPVFGNGDDMLGGKLMKSFLATLPEMGAALWRVILLNGGVTLAARDSAVLAELQALEQAGVTVLVCGTCLEHFGLLSQKAVGETTNMLDVVTSMQIAHKIIRV